MITQQQAKPMPHFNGSDYSKDLDHDRLGRQINEIFGLMKDGQYRTLREIEQATGHPQASCSAQLRNLRKSRFGGHLVNKRRRPSTELDRGIFEYQLVVVSNS